MKKTILLLSVFFTTVSFSQNFPGKEIQLLLNKELRVLPVDSSLQKYGYDHFYTSDKFGGYEGPTKWKYECCESYNSKYKSLVGKTFKVLSYEPYKTIIGEDKYKMKIENSEIGILYFDYGMKYDFDFPFEVVGGLELPPDFYCRNIKTSFDKFTGETKYDTEISDGVTLEKVEKDGAKKIYLYIRVSGATISIGEKGATLLLENKKRIERPNEPVDVKTSSSTYSSSYVYSVFMELTNDEINLLKENNITDVRLYVYDREIKYGTRIKEYLKCLTK